MSALRYVFTIILFISIILIYKYLTHKEYKYSDVIEIKQGKLRGTIEKSAGGKNYFSFKGIPYANAERFSLPKLNKSWDGNLEATEYVVCLQMRAMEKTVIGVEDCLVLNVYTPTLDNDANKAVMVYIHGGGYFQGSSNSDLFGPELFMDKDIVLVTINYRLGPLGFLSDGNDALPGNQGLWDQRAALMWVKDNIKSFGGNPKKVTLFGESAGASSAMFQLFSPQSGPNGNKLFHAVIAQSGTPSSNFVRTDKHPGYYSRTLADVVGCDPKADTDMLLKCLKAVDPNLLVKNGYLNYHFLLDTYPFKPVVDGVYRGIRGFVPRDPWELLSNGFASPVPMIIGFNKDEGLLLAALYEKELERYENLKNNWDTIATFGIFYREEDEQNEEEKSIANDYLVNQLKNKIPKSGDDLKPLSDLYGDPHFQMISLSYARKFVMNSKEPVYSYSYEHQGSFGYFGAAINPLGHILFGCLFHSIGLPNWNIFDNKVAGVSHADDIFAMFKPHRIPCNVIQSKEDAYVSESILTLWTNFAKTGNPSQKFLTEDKDINITWLPTLEEKNFQHLKIGTNSIEMTTNDEYEERLKVWENIWENVPPLIHLWRSETWRTLKSYRTSKTGNIKQEL